MESEVFLMKPKHQFVYPSKEIAFMVPNHEKKRDYYMNPCLPHLIENFDSKKWWEVKFLLWNKSFNSFIPISRMNLWCARIKRKEIIKWIHDYPIWQINFDSKRWLEVKFFFWNPSINSFIPIRRMRLWCPIMERKKIIIWIHIYHIW